MSERRDALAREKEMLLLRSALGRLRMRLAAERIRGTRGALFATRIAWVARLGRAILASRA
jgi:hypothetical protein